MKRASRAIASAFMGMVLAVLTGLGATSASASPREGLQYDALGDSFASGYGVPPYSACGRSESAYPVQLEGRMKIELDDFVACAGATTGSLMAGGQLLALDEDTDLVTLMIGGNDIRWGQAVAACLGGTDAQCAAATGLATNAITNVLPGLLDVVYSQVSERAPHAHVVVVGYPRLFSPEFGDYLGASTSEQQTLNDGADRLNGVIAGAADDFGFQFVDVTQRFVGHGVNAPAPWILGPGAGAFHPNVNGYQAYTAAITSQINPSQLK